MVASPPNTVTITLNGEPLETEAGRALVEVIKESGTYISNLCYLDGLPPYAGCRTCVVEGEGMRGLPRACSTAVSDGMVVRTDTEATIDMRQEVMAFILANHSDRCLTCHRVEHCRTGDICLRDNVVTHRCVTCSKNYRCELQTASDVADMGRSNVEPYLDEARTYYQFEQPPPDRGNPFFEFDPQMCILCTRCERACDDLRHTTAITLAGRGFSTRMAFGAGGAIDESNCDFCGACVDVCPTATLMEAPNKWVARPERWVSTTCTECSMGCTIQMGIREGRGVIVRPAAGNDVSRDQICVRGRFGYDQVRDRQRLITGRLGRGADGFAAETSAVVRDAAAKLASMIQEHGPQAVGLLGSGQATTEENYALAQLAEWIGTPNLDASVGSAWGAVEEALLDAFGSVHLPTRLTSIESADAIVAIGDDISASNNVVGVRIKDAVVNHGATLVTISRRDSALEFHATMALRAPLGELASLTQDLAIAATTQEGVRQRLGEIAAPTANSAVAANLTEAATALTAKLNGKVAVVLAPSRHSAAATQAQARAAINLTIALAGPAAAANSLHILPPENNVIGLRDVGLTPAAPILTTDEHGNQTETEAGGLHVADMLEAARSGSLKAMIIAKDNPVLLLPDRANVRSALEALELLLVIDDVPTETVQLATHVLADLPALAKDGSITNADRQIMRLRPAIDAASDARPAWHHLQALANQLKPGAGLAFTDARAVLDAIAAEDLNYVAAAGSRLLRQARQPLNGAQSPNVFLEVASLTTSNSAADGLALVATRDLFSDREAAAASLHNADRLERAKFLELHPDDAASRGLHDGDEVTVGGNGAALTATLRLNEDATPGTALLPLLWRAGAVQALVGPDEAIPSVVISKN